MVKTQNNKWFWIASGTWTFIVLGSKFFLGNLIYAALIKALASSGIPESEMIAGLLNIGLPLAILFGGIYFIYFCIQQIKKEHQKHINEIDFSPTIKVSQISKIMEKKKKIFRVLGCGNYYRRKTL